VALVVGSLRFPLTVRSFANDEALVGQLLSPGLVVLAARAAGDERLGQPPDAAAAAWTDGGGAYPHAR